MQKPLALLLKPMARPAQHCALLKCTARPTLWSVPENHQSPQCQPSTRGDTRRHFPFFLRSFSLLLYSSFSLFQGFRCQMQFLVETVSFDLPSPITWSIKLNFLKKVHGNIFEQLFTQCYCVKLSVSSKLLFAVTKKALGISNGLMRQNDTLTLRLKKDVANDPANR